MRPMARSSNLAARPPLNRFEFCHKFCLFLFHPHPRCVMLDSDSYQQYTKLDLSPPVKNETHFDGSIPITKPHFYGPLAVLERRNSVSVADEPAKMRVCKSVWRSQRYIGAGEHRTKCCPPFTVNSHDNAANFHPSASCLAIWH